MSGNIHIVARKNGVGIDRDVAILQNALRSVAQLDYRSPKRPESIGIQLRALFNLRQASFTSRLYLFVERIPRLIGRLPGCVALIPNQERFPRRHIGRLKHVDVVLCKTQHAKEIFDSLSCQTEFIGFTSVDRGMPEVSPNFDRFLHLAGRSTLKGTETLLEAWNRHPEWPELTLVQCEQNAPKSVPPNVSLVTDYVPDHELRLMQNQHGVHLCPSLSEGWGHYIVEAMSCGALVATTDGPPMNELVSPDRGVLIPSRSSEPRHLGTNWHVDAGSIETAIQTILDMPSSQEEELGASARAWYESNDTAFHQRMLEIGSRLLCRKMHRPRKRRAAYSESL